MSKRFFRSTRGAILTAGVLLVLAGCDASLNQDIEIAAGAERGNGAMTINGNVRVGRDAVADASLRTVNGSIRVAEGAQVGDCATVNGVVEIGSDTRTGDLETVNGDLRIGTGARVGGNIKLVNGNIEVLDGTEIDGSVGTVNGRIVLHGTSVGGSVSNVMGGMLITGGSHVRGDLRVKGAEDDPHAVPPEIIIGPDTVIDGELDFERPVKLLIHDSASVGEIRGAEAVRYRGQTPSST
jgi:cytoskeletal protein CcmA (bactofilin family)